MRKKRMHVNEDAVSLRSTSPRKVEMRKRKAYFEEVREEILEAPTLSLLSLESDSIYHRMSYGLANENRRQFAHLVRICKRASFLYQCPAEDEYVVGLRNLVMVKPFWINSPEKWEPSSDDPESQFASLIRFLLTKYDVPAFFYKIWKSVDSPDIYKT